MRVEDQELLDYFKMLPCLWCHAPPPCAPAHWYARGMDSGSRLDIPENVASLCLFHHNSQHNGGHPNREELMGLIAKREGKTVDECKAIVWGMLRAPKEEK